MSPIMKMMILAVGERPSIGGDVVNCSVALVVIVEAASVSLEAINNEKEFCGNILVDVRVFLRILASPLKALCLLVMKEFVVEKEVWNAYVEKLHTAIVERIDSINFAIFAAQIPIK